MPGTAICGRAQRPVRVVTRRPPTSRPIYDTGIPWIMDDDELFRAEISQHYGPLIRRRSVLVLARLAKMISVIAYPVSDALAPPRLSAWLVFSELRAQNRSDED